MDKEDCNTLGLGLCTVRNTIKISMKATSMMRIMLMTFLIDLLNCKRITIIIRAILRNRCLGKWRTIMK